MKRALLGTALTAAAACLPHAALAAAAQGTAAAGCSIAVHGRVVLASDPVDPDVFVWDTSEHLIDYTADRWNSTRTIFSWTTLAKPGTLAQVVQCLPSVARPRYSTGAQDVIRVRVLNGPFHGKMGWVLSSDLHPEPAPSGNVVQRH